MPPKMIARIAELGASDAELDAIVNALQQLAADPQLGYKVPFQGAGNRERRRFDVGRFGLIYEFDEKTLGLIQVID
ncbi:MAG: hypothetical protein ABI972_07625 [Acidobacteriota bacterium]